MRNTRGQKNPLRKRITVDPDKLRAAFRGLDRVELLEVLDRALKVIPKARLPEITLERMPAQDLAPDSDFLAEVMTFCDRSRRGDFYESFRVDSRNSTEKSIGTEHWIAECERLFRQCLLQAEKLGPAQTRKALQSLFDVLRLVDAGEDIVFWADEGGSYEVYVDWKKVMPLWFRSLSATAAPDDYVREATAAIEDFNPQDRELLLKRARSAGNREQRAALETV